MNDAAFDVDRDAVLSRMREANVAAIVVGTDREMSEKAIALAEEYPDLVVGATIGLHPADNHDEEFDGAWYTERAKHPRVVGIGECGFEYYWPSQDGWPHGEKEEKARQRELFERQIAIAVAAGKPLMLHGRPSKGSMDAYLDMLEVLEVAYRTHGEKVRGDAHYFAGDIEIAKRFLDLGFTLSFTGVVTFTHDYDEVIRFAPLDRILCETDAPYVAPTPYRGKRNEPSYVREVYRVIVELKGMKEDDLSETLRMSAVRVFGIGT